MTNKELLENLVISTEYKTTVKTLINRLTLENLVISTEYKTGGYIHDSFYNA